MKAQAGPPGGPSPRAHTEHTFHGGTRTTSQLHAPQSSPLIVVKMKVHRVKGAILFFALVSTSCEERVFPSRTVADERGKQPWRRKFRIYRITATRKALTPLNQLLNNKSLLLLSKRRFRDLENRVTDEPTAAVRSRLTKRDRTFKVCPLFSTTSIVTSTFLATLLPPFSNSPLSIVMYKSFLISPSRREN